MPAATMPNAGAARTAGERVCVLHIGMHKTGTSSIQRMISENFDELRDRFGIASYRRHLNHSALAPAFVDDLSQVRSNLAPGLEKPEDVHRQAVSAVEDLGESLARDRPPSLVLSGEGFSKLPETAVPRLKRFLEPHFDRVHVAIYVREPFSYANSAAAQRIKVGSTFENLIADTLIHQEIYATHPDSSSVLPTYRYRIEKFVEAFGRDNVEIVPFARSALRGQDAVNDFFWRFLAIESAELARQPERENEALAPAALHALEYLNREEPVLRDGWLNPARSQSLPAKLSALPRTGRFSIPGFDYDAFAEIVRPDVEWLEAITGGAIVFGLEPPPPAPPPSAADLLAIATALNHQSVERDRQAVRTVFFRELWRIGYGRTTDPQELIHVVKICTEPEFLRNAAHILRVSKLPDIARIADARAAYLRSRQP